MKGLSPISPTRPSPVPPVLGNRPAVPTPPAAAPTPRATTTATAIDRDGARARAPRQPAGGRTGPGEEQQPETGGGRGEDPRGQQLVGERGGDGEHRKQQHTGRGGRPGADGDRVHATAVTPNATVTSSSIAGVAGTGATSVRIWVAASATSAASSPTAAGPGRCPARPIR